MFVRLFYTLRRYGIPVSTRELIDLNQAVSEGLVFADQEEFYQLAKTILVKDERFFDKFDRAMKDYFEGISTFDIDDVLKQVQQLPKEWLDLELLEKNLTPEQREELKKAGDAGQQFGKALAAGIDFVLGPIQFLIDKIIWVSDNIGALTQKAVEFKNSVSDMAGGAWQKTKDFFSNPFGDDAPQGNAMTTPQTPASALPAPALANRGGSTYTDSSTTTIQVTQRPGENNADLAKRIADEQERRRQVRQRSMMNDGVTAP